MRLLYKQGQLSYYNYFRNAETFLITLLICCKIQRKYDIAQYFKSLFIA